MASGRGDKSVRRHTRSRASACLTSRVRGARATVGGRGETRQVAGAGGTRSARWVAWTPDPNLTWR